MKITRTCLLLLLILVGITGTGLAEGESKRGRITCANLVYGAGKTSNCFARQFLSELAKDSNVRTNDTFTTVKLESKELFLHPFAVMTGDGEFTLTDAQRTNMKRYLQNGGFIVCSASCSSLKWAMDMRNELHKIFPNNPLKQIEKDHPIFSIVYDVTPVKLYGLEIDGKIVLILSDDGLNDTKAKDVPPSCCCCGGKELKEARKINANLLAYALAY